MSKPIAVTPALSSRSISSASRARGQGQRPSRARLGSSMATITTRSLAATGPRTRWRKSRNLRSSTSSGTGAINRTPAIVIAIAVQTAVTPNLGSRMRRSHLRQGRPLGTGGGGGGGFGLPGVSSG